jgi:hypothetical protein
MRRRLPARRTVAGFVAAPPAVGLAAALVILFPFPDAFPLIAIGATLIAAIATVFLGLPTYVLLRAMGRTGRLVHIACGALLGGVVALIGAGLDVSLASVHGLRIAALYALLCAPLGALAAFVFWTVARPDRIPASRHPSR